MRWLFLGVLSAIVGFCLKVPATTKISSADDITEEWLVDVGKKTGYTEHIRHFKRLFSKMHVRTFLEFGCGFSTKYFIDHSEKVISVEFVTPGSGPEWLKYCMELYQDCTSWMPIAYFSGPCLDTSWASYKYIGSESVYKAAAYQPVYRKSYAMVDPSFLLDLNKFVNQQIAENAIDVAFVDAGICIRGDLVQILFGKVPVIVAHDIGRSDRRKLNEVYGYGRLDVPKDYVEIYIPFGMGTAFWVKREDKYLEVIKGLQEYAKKGAAR